ncbi:myoneurin-like isoform X2 [Ruditapes philippinarum]|uniref:myoneurin-like isoform X2 n=1 Tax=Ruditapes philippinarum TaxID=129788 RepID=UPI00295BA2CC|nr:myoneurin-like isoform X2 [Ruditapes philippinarum]
MEDSDEFKWAVKVVIKRQMRDLMEQLRERGEEIAILTVNLDDNTCSHFGSPSGEWFVSEQKNLAQNFLKFCTVKSKNAGNVISTGSIFSSKTSTVKQRTTQSAGQSQNTDSHISNDIFSSPKSSPVKRGTKKFEDAPTLTVTVPKRLAGDVTEEELASLVGRIVASQLAVQEKGDGSSSGTKFDLLVEAANNAKKNRGTSSVVSTPSTRSTRKRKVSQRYKEGITSLKKGIKSEDDDTVCEIETEHNENVIVSMLTDLSKTILKRVKVKTSEEVPVNIEKSVLASSDQLESLAVLLIQEIDEMAGGLLRKEKLVEVTVILDEANTDSKVTIEVEGIGIERVKNEAMDDSDMEYLDENVDEEEEDDNYMDPSDPTFEPEAFSSVKRPKITSSIKTGDMNSSKLNTPQSLKRKPKKKRPLTETMPIPCEYCGLVLTGKSSLKAHVNRVHLKLRGKVCTICGKGFCTATARESHMLSVHARRCETCQEYVVETVPWSTGMDMRTKRDVICSCGSIVSIHSNLGRKRQYLREDEPDEDGNLPEPEIKKVSNTAGMKYACGACGKLFRKRANCRFHSRIHTNYKGIKCEICGNYFSHQSSLKYHMQTHGIYKHKCEICGESFSKKTDLYDHNSKYHPQENITVGKKVVTVVKKKGNDTADLERQMKKRIEREQEDVEESDDQQNEQSTQLSEGTSLGVSESGRVVVTQGEDGQVTLTTESGQPVGDSEAARIIRQVIADGQIVAQEGNMSIIIKTINN